MAKQAETKFKERIKPELEALPHSWWLKTQMVSTLGIPDFIGCVGGRFIALELKRNAHEKARPLQLWVLDKVRQAGGYALVVSPEIWDSVYSSLTEIAIRYF